MNTVRVDQASTVRACLFSLAGEVFAVDVRWAREVVVVEDLTVVPRAPSYLAGVANVRGHVLPILDIRSLLGLPARGIGRGTRALVIEAGSLQAAVATDRVLGLQSFDEIMPVGEAAPKQWGAFGVGLLRRDEGLVTLLDVPRMLEALRIRAPEPARPPGPAPFVNNAG